jgi:hypothetical protein
MDPTTTLTEILIGLAERDIDITDHLDFLRQWLRKGGFFPDVDKALADFEARR